MAAPVAPEDAEGLPHEEVGDRRWHDLVDPQPGPVDPDVRQQRLPDAVVELLDDLLHRVSVDPESHVLHDPAAQARHAGEQVPVDLLAHAKGEEAGAADVVADVAQDLLVVADIPIGHEADDPHALRVRRRLQRGPDAREHLGASLGLHRVHEAQPARQILRRILQRPLGHRRHAGREVQHLEGVLGAQVGERVAHRSLGLVHGLAHHRAGRVDDEDHLLGRHLARLDRPRRLQRQHEGPRLPARRLMSDHRGHRAGAGQPIPHLNRAVGHLVGVGQLDPRLAGLGVLDLELVRRRVDLEDLRSRPQRELHADAVLQRDAGGRDRRVDRRLVRVERHRPRWHVARPDDGREGKRPLACVVGDRRGVVKRHVHLLARHDVRDALLEEVGPLLLGQGGVAPLLDRLLVLLAGGLLLADLGLDEAPPDDEPHAVDRRIVGQREAVDALERLVEGVYEGLRDHHRRVAGHQLPGDVGVLHREGALRPVCPHTDQGDGVAAEGIARCRRG